MDEVNVREVDNKSTLLSLKLRLPGHPETALFKADSL